MKKRNEAIVKIACCQMEPIVGEKERNIRRSSEMIEEAAKEGAVHLHVRVVGAAATFGHYPVNVLCRILDIAGFTMDTILRVYLEPGVAVLFNIFVDAGRAKTSLRPIIIGKVDGERHRAVY